MKRLEKISKAEVMNHLDKTIPDAMTNYLKPVEKIWQPADLLPDSNDENFFEDVKTIQEKASNLSYELLVVLIGDTITEEALPTYESWLSGLNNINQHKDSGWNRWVRAWTAEENRHGDILNKYLYLSGRINMKQMEISTQYLLADGFDIGTSRDPYRNFVYTSFQELATNLSHRRVAQFAKKSGDDLLGRICGHVAADEMRHANAYKSFVSQILEVDPSEMILAFEDMMRKKIVMPAHYLREKGGEMSSAFAHFSEVAQRLGVYTAVDYIDIMKSLLDEWKVETLAGLNDSAEKGRDYLMALPARLHRLVDRMAPKPTHHKFKWVYA